MIGIIDLTGMCNLTGNPVQVSAADGDSSTGWVVWATIAPDADPIQELPAQDRYRVVRYLVTSEVAARYPGRWDIWVESDATHSPSGELTHHRGIARAYPDAAAPSLFGRRTR